MEVTTSQQAIDAVLRVVDKEGVEHTLYEMVNDKAVFTKFFAELRSSMDLLLRLIALKQGKSYKQGKEAGYKEALIGALTKVATERGKIEQKLEDARTVDAPPPAQEGEFDDATRDESSDQQ